jgi:hypothetical protein
MAIKTYTVRLHRRLIQRGLLDWTFGSLVIHSIILLQRSKDKSKLVNELLQAVSYNLKQTSVNWMIKTPKNCLFKIKSEYWNLNILR